MAAACTSNLGFQAIQKIPMIHAGSGVIWSIRLESFLAEHEALLSLTIDWPFAIVLRWDRIVACDLDGVLHLAVEP